MISTIESNATRRTGAALLAAFVMLALHAPAPATAQGGDGEGGPLGLGWGIRPKADVGFFEFTLPPGESITDSLLVVNGTSEPVELRVWPVEARTAQRGGVGFGDQAGGITSWLDLEDSIYALGAGESVEVPITVTAPPNAAPGEYVAGIVSADRANLEAPEGEAAAGVHVITRVGVAVVIRVPGPRQCAIRIESASADFGPAGDFAAIMGLANDGNVGFRGTGTAELTPANGGAPAFVRDFRVGYVIAGDSTIYPLYEEGPPPGEYTLSATVSGEGDSEGCTDSITAPVSITAEQSEEAAKAAAAETITDRPAPIMDRLTESPILLLAGASGLLGFGLLGAVGLYWYTDRKRRQQAARARRRRQGPRPPSGRTGGRS